MNKHTNTPILKTVIFIFGYEEKNIFYSCIFIYACVFKLFIQSKIIDTLINPSTD